MDTEIKAPVERIWSYPRFVVVFLMSGLGQNMALHASPIAKNVFIRLHFPQPFPAYDVVEYIDGYLVFNCRQGLSDFDL